MNYLQQTLLHAIASHAICGGWRNRSERLLSYDDRRTLQEWIASGYVMRRGKGIALSNRAWMDDRAMRREKEKP
jgi:hypothetical protein